MISIGVASLPERVHCLEKAIDSIYYQVDQIFVCLNNYKEIPEFLKRDKITAVISDNSMGDAGKFMFYNKCEGIFLSIDDDLIYPDNYVFDIVCSLNEHGGVVTYHGSVLKPNAHRYYMGRKEVFRCTKELKEDKPVDVPGTGCMAVRTSDLKLREFESRNMADLWVAKWAKEQGLKIPCVKHEPLIYQEKEMKGKSTIFGNHINNDWQQSRLMREITA